MLTQYTGSMGSTLCGIAYSLNQEMLRHVFFNFDKAKEFEFINFDYYHVNSFMGQTEAPVIMRRYWRRRLSMKQ